MGDSPRRDSYSRSPSPRRGRSRSRSPARNDSFRDGEAHGEAGNPGNNLYVTGLSTRVTEKDLEGYFSKEGKVVDCRLVVDPRSRASRGFAFVTMETLEDADCCVKYLHRSTFEGRVITVEKAKRKRARTPTPGEYLGVRAALHIRSRGYGGGDYRDSYRSRRSPRYSPYRGGRDGRDRSPQYSPYRGRSPQYSPYRGHRHDRSRSPAYSPYR